MNEQAGPACALSVLIIGAFAVLLHDETRRPPPPRLGPPSVATGESPRRDPRPASSAPAPSAPTRIETTLIARPPSPPVTTRKATGPGSKGMAGVVKSADPGGRPIALGAQIDPPPPVPKPAKRPPAPRGDFTVVEAGESLADVAERVYGSGRAVESLWKANRDQLAGIESPLPRGTLLRTPRDVR